MFYFSKRRKPEILHNFTLILHNLHTIIKRAVSARGRRLPIETREIYSLFFSALPAPVPLYFERVELKV